MTELQKELYRLGESEYAAFQLKLTPGIPKDSVLGVRVPVIRRFAKDFIKTKEAEPFLSALPHKYYDENMLHSVLLSQIKDFDAAISAVDGFLPFVDNWAVCDILSPIAFKKNHDRLIDEIRRWTSSKETYTCRFGMEMLMSHFLDKDFRKEYLEIPASVKSDEYYVNMMAAWFFATALSKQWNDTVPYIENKLLTVWVHNKTIQKAVESRRISDERKNYLRTLKIK